MTTSTATSTKMTAKQEQFIVSLCNQLTGERYRFVSQHRNFLDLSSSKCQRLSKTEASAIIDELKARV
jgi:hypothetical protein